MKVKVCSPIQFYENFTKWLMIPQRKFIFKWSLISCFLVHFLFLTNNLTTGDSMVRGAFYTANDSAVKLGRFLVKYISWIKKDIVSLFTMAVIGFVVLSLCCIFICDLLEIKHHFFCLLVILAITTSPSLVKTMNYIYCFDSYCLAVLFSILALYFLFSNKSIVYRIIMASLCIAISLSIYQVYIGFTAAIGIIKLINLILDKNKQYFEKLISGIVSIVLGGLLYLVLYNLVLYLNHFSLSSRADGLFENIIIKFPSRIGQAYIDFYNYFFTDSILNNTAWTRHYIWGILFFCGIISLLILIIKRKIIEDKKAFCLLAVLLCLFPLACTFVDLVIPTENLKLITAYPLTAVFIFIVYLLYEMYSSNTPLTNVILWGGIISSLAMFFGVIFMDQATYMSLKQTYNHTYQFALRVVDRMEAHEGYKDGMSVLIAGGPSNETLIANSKIDDLGDGQSSVYNTFHANYSANRSSWRTFLREELGVIIKMCSEEEYLEIIKSEEFAQLGVWPRNDSMGVINGIFVIKLTDSPKLP